MGAELVGVVGAGVIGLSWARLFADRGWRVHVVDPRPDLGEVLAEVLPNLEVSSSPVVDGGLVAASFVQEAGPERLEVKRDVFRQLAEVTTDAAVLASSSSSLLPSLIAEGNPAAERIVIGHPFNPPELMPLVEVVPGPVTSPGTVARAVEVYESLGKRPITLAREIPGFVGNRLQKALNQEATYLVQQGIISAGDLDELFKTSLGLRYATVGPFESRHLGGGPGGIRHLAAHVGSQMTFDLGTPDPALNEAVYSQVEQAYGSGAEAYQRRSHARDQRTRAVSDALQATDAALETTGDD